MESRTGKKSGSAKGNATTSTAIGVLDRRKTTGSEGADGSNNQLIHKLVDPKTGESYYYNQLTGESTWDEPNEQHQRVVSKGESTESEGEKPEEWIQLVDSSGRAFEYNRTTAESRWITTKKAKQDPASFESMIRETSKRPGEIYIIQNSAADQAYLYDRNTGESRYLNEIPPDAVMASVRSDDDETQDGVATDLDNSVVDYEQETETEESSEDDEQQQSEDQIEDLSDLLEGLLLVRAIHEVESLFETWPTLSHFIEVFVSPHTNWSTLMIIHKAVMSELGEFHKFKNGLATNNLHTNKASWLRWLGTVLTEWETKSTSLHRQYADELSLFLKQIDPKSSKCPFRLKRSSDEDPRPTYSALDARTRLAIFSCLCRWALLKRSYFVDESMRSSFATSARAWNLGQDASKRTYFWFPTLAVTSLFRGSDEKESLKRLSHDEETMGEVIESLLAKEPPAKLKNWFKFIQSRVLTASSSSSSEIQISMDQNEVQEEEESKARKALIMDNGLYYNTSYNAQYYNTSYNAQPPPPPLTSSHYIDPFGSSGMFRSVVVGIDGIAPQPQNGGAMYSPGLVGANNASAAGAQHAGMYSTGLMSATDHAFAGNVYPTGGMMEMDKGSGPQGGGMYSRLMSQNMNYGYSFQFPPSPFVIMDQVRLVRPLPISSSMDHLQTNQSAFMHSPYISHTRPPTVTTMANGTMVMPTASDQQHNGHNSSALATLLSAAQRMDAPWVGYQLEANNGGSLNQQNQNVPSFPFNHPATTENNGSAYQAVNADEDDTFTAAQRESEGSSGVVPVQTGVTPLKLPDWLKDTQSGSKGTGGNTTSKSRDANVPSTDSLGLFKQLPASSSSEHADLYKEMLPPPVRPLPPFSELTDTTSSSASANENVGLVSSQHSSPMRRSPKIAVRSPPLSFFPSGAPSDPSPSSSLSSPIRTAAPGSSSKMAQLPTETRFKPSIVYDDNSSWSGSSKGAPSAGATTGSNPSPIFTVDSRVNASPNTTGASKELIDLVEEEPAHKTRMIITQEDDVSD